MAATVTLHCDMYAACIGKVTRIDSKGYVYCTYHGKQLTNRGVRKLTPEELATLESGSTIKY